MKCKKCSSVVATGKLWNIVEDWNYGAAVYITYRYFVDMDLSNSSMFLLYAKLGLHRTNFRKHGALHINVMPRRLDCKEIRGGGRSVGFLRKLPANLRVYWESVAHVFISRSEAKIVIVAGNTGVGVYTEYLKESNISHTCIWPHGSRRHQREVPSAWVEYTSDSKDQIKRAAFVVSHPERFNRERGAIITNVQRGIWSEREAY